MDIVIYGAGGIGSYLGALLSQAGHRITLVCRGAHLRAISERGLRVRDRSGDWTAARVQAVERLTDERPDVIVVGVKSYDLAAVGPLIARHVDTDTLVVPIANGVASYEELGRFIPLASIAPGTIFMSSHVVEPGLVMRTSDSSRLSFGELDGRLSQRAVAFHEAGMRAGYESQLSTTIVTDLWVKFVMLNAVVPLSILARQPIGVLRSDPALRALMIESMREVIAVAQAKGIALPADLIEYSMRLSDERDARAKVSILQDIEGGRRLELDSISGYICREGRRLGVATPLSDLAYACAAPLKNGSPQ